MKKTFITLLALAGVATGETVVLTLPSTQRAVAGIGAANSISVSVNDASNIAKFAGSDIGIYMFCNGGQTDIGAEEGSTEGTWTLSGDTATVELWGRKQYSGTNVAVVTNGGLNEGATVSALTLSTTGLTGNTDDYSVYFGLVDDVGNILASDVQNNLGTSPANITLNFVGEGNNDALVWKEDYTLILGFVSEAGSSWNAKSYVNGIKLEANLVPEPTTATLSLLALAGLAARRRRA